MKQILLVGVLLIALLSGCKHGSENNTGNQQSSVSQEDAPAPQSTNSPASTPEDLSTSNQLESSAASQENAPAPQSPDPATPPQENTPAPQSPDLATPTKKDISTPQSLEPSEATQEDTPTSQSFEKGVFVDFSKLNEDFITDDILQKLKDNLDALVNKDEDKFKAGLLDGHDTPGNMDFVKNTNQYKFLDISETRYNQNAKSIIISLSVKILRDKNIYDSTISYYFKTDKTGEWKISLID
jgi:hypothetical protein